VIDDSRRRGVMPFIVSRPCWARESRESEMTLLDTGWTEEQAQGLLDSLKLNGGMPAWKLEHLQRLHDWCMAHDKDSTTVEAQLDFVAYELLNSFQAVGMFLKRAKTVEQAREAVQPYVSRLAPL
jgi:hypothetical protein